MPDERVGDDAVREQVEFYRAQAAHYPHEGHPDDDRVLDRCPPAERCLELASGSGRWTQHLLRVCGHVTAVDASPEMHARNRALNGTDRVDHLVADIFEFATPGRFDLVFAGAWLSHVPPERFHRFWSMVADVLRPGGRVVMVDDGVEDRDGGQRFATDASGSGPERRAADGRPFTIVKVAYAPERLESLLADLGWAASVTPLSPESYLLEARRS